MYNTDAKILRQICRLMNDITKKYKRSDEDEFTLSSAKAVLMKIVREIESKQP